MRQRGKANLIGTLDQRYREATVVGAGIAGMLAAYALDKRGYRVTLLEQKPRAGGLIHTTRTEHGIAESAAHSLVATEPVRELCRELGVELVGPRKESRAKFVVRNGKLARFPLNLSETLNLAGHVAFNRSTHSTDQNVDGWARQHLGDSATDYLLTPFVRGIYGVQPKELGISAAFPFLNLPEGQTLLNALLHKVSKRSRKTKKVRAAPRFGMGDLVDRLEQHLEERLGLRFRTQEKINELPDAGNLILATPAYAAAALMQSRVPQLAEELRSVHYTPIVSVTTFVERRSFSQPIRGTGVLMPAREETKSLGILFNSSSFEYRVTDDSRLASFTVMMGGTAHPEWLDCTDAEIQQAVKLELSNVLGIREPHYTVIHRWPAALPQYSVDLPRVWQKAWDTWCVIPGRILFGNYTGQISLRGMIESAAKLN
jgi:oxygen-dependent protoporphyrinogen oxidase